MLNDAHPADATCMFTDEMYCDCYGSQYGINLQRQVTPSNAVELKKYVINHI